MSLDLNTAPMKQNFMSRIKWPSLLILDPQGVNTWPSVWANNEEQHVSGRMEMDVWKIQLITNSSYRIPHTVCYVTWPCRLLSACWSVMNVTTKVTTLAQAIKVKLQLLRKPIYRTLDLFWKHLFYPESQFKSTWITTELLMAKKPTQRSLGLPCAHVFYVSPCVFINFVQVGVCGLQLV